MPFAGILGQDKSISLLRRTLASEKIASAYLFEGIDGCGKKGAAVAFVEAAFCGRDEGCGLCPSCRKIAAMQHPDLHMVEPEGAFIKIDRIRELQRELSLRPFEAPKKACIIDGAEKLNPAAANALLKTLEEPPGDALMILITANADGVLPTVLSRCQRLRFSPLPEDALATLLMERGIAEEAAGIIASLSGGSMSRALEIGEERILGDRKGFLDRMGALSLGEIAPLFSLAEEFSGDRERAIELLELLSSFLRDALLIASGGGEAVNSDLLPQVKTEAERFTPERIMERIDRVRETRRAIMGNVNARLALEVLFMRLAEN